MTADDARTKSRRTRSGAPTPDPPAIDGGAQADLEVDHGRDIVKEVTVPASRAAVWRAWTTGDGVTTFFARAARIELRPGGRYELLFDTEAAAGSQGSEGMRVLSYLPEEMLSFEWNAPPRFPEIRAGGRRTWVVVRFDDADPKTTAGDDAHDRGPIASATRVRLTHLGWPADGRWDEVRAYFLDAWDIVLGRLVHRFASGPIDGSARDR